MFCTSLRRRPSYAPIVPSLTTHGGLGLRESQLVTHDISLPFASTIDPNTGNTLSTRHLRLLLLSPSSVTDTELTATLQRIQHFASLTGGQDIAIVFLLLSKPDKAAFVTAKEVAKAAERGQADDGSSAAVHAYTKLQVELFPHQELQSIPILPLAGLSSLSDRLKAHVAALTRPPPPPPSPPPPQHHHAHALELLSLCTANPPMPQQTAYLLSDLFLNIRELAAACTTATSGPASSPPSARTVAGALSSPPADGDDFDGGLALSPQRSEVEGKLRRLRDLVGEQGYRDIVDFWAEEWTVD